MSENNELLTSYQKLRKSVDQMSEENRILTEKVNSLATLLEAEREEKTTLARKGILEKINAISPEFKPTEDMSVESLRWILKGMESVPAKKTNSKETLPDEEITPEEPSMKLNGKAIPEELKQFVARREDNSKIFEIMGEATE